MAFLLSKRAKKGHKYFLDICDRYVTICDRRLLLFDELHNPDGLAILFLCKIFKV